MANAEHKQLAQYVKDVHSSLRKASSRIGVEKAWNEHCKNEHILFTYAKSMEKLATVHWEKNSLDKSKTVVSRIDWSADFCLDYYINNNYLKCRDKELEISNKMNIGLKMLESFSLPLKLLDVGSCYNPFEKYTFLNVFAIDLYPANESVHQCDFLNVFIGEKCIVNDKKVEQLQQNCFDVVTFCFFLEYLPTSELRVQACTKAYKLLKYGGLLLINTPDSKHVGANYKIMKHWRYTLASLGFSRIKYEKLKHMHCMAFRKSLDKRIAIRWTTLCKEQYIDYSLNIPQDFISEEEEIVKNSSALSCYDTKWEYLEELPFNNLEC